jgi:hypothetical protein
MQEIHGMRDYLERTIKIEEMDERDMKLGLAKSYVYRHILPGLIHPVTKKPLLEGDDRRGFTSDVPGVFVRNHTSVSLRPKSDQFLNRVKE